MPAEAAGQLEATPSGAPPLRTVTAVRGRWRSWRRSRPFWGGLLALLAGAEICAIPLAPLKVMMEQGIAGIPSVLLGIVMILMGCSAWFAPHYRNMAGILVTLIAVAALVMSNLGGFLIGTVLGILGGSMIFAWRPMTALQASSLPEADSASEAEDDVKKNTESSKSPYTGEYTE